MAFALTANAYAADFGGTGVGPIPDNTPAGINISFNSAGFNQPVGDVKLKLNINHTWMGDLKVTLTSPGGVATMVMMSRAGVRTGGGYPNADLAGVYTFSDFGGDLWAAVPVAGVIPPGAYRTSTRGAELTPSGTNSGGGCFTSMAGAFAGLSPVDASGVWTLNIADVAAGDAGNVTAATLTLTPQADAIFGSGFEVASRGICKLARMDFTGRGRSSYVVVRNTGGGPSGDVTWFVKDNNSAAGGADSSFLFGKATDRFLQGDWDGDGLADAAVWRPGTPALFIIRPSSHPTLLRTLAFGQTGDDPSITDDFDGDGLTDFAVFRAGASTGLASHTLIKLNASGAERDVTTGVNGSFPASGDYNGDGMADIANQESVGGAGNFRLFNTVTGAQFSTFTQGLPTDIIIDGNYAGTFYDDITTVRAVGGVLQWTTRDSATATIQPTVAFGASSTDFALTGDYDGDGLDDYSIWRPSATVGASKFSVRPSAAPATPIDIPMGANGDYPVGNARTH
ncbi:MAG: proprotein convertase P-domain-containing protein [Dokdonella sp.]